MATMQELLDALGTNEEAKTLVTETFAKAEAAGKIQIANREISEERDALKEAKKALKAEKDALEIKINAETAKGTATPELSKLLADNERLKTDLADLTGKFTASETAKEQSERLAKEASLTSQFTALLSKGNAKNPDDALAIMKARGHIKQDETSKEYLTLRLNKEKKFEAATAEETVANFLESNPDYVKPSGNNGSGQSHTGGGNTGSGGLLKSPRDKL